MAYPTDHDLPYGYSIQAGTDRRAVRRWASKGFTLKQAASPGRQSPAMKSKIESFISGSPSWPKSG